MARSRKPAKPFCARGCTLTTTEPTCPDHGDAKGVRVLMPNGTGCYYVDADHSYWRMKPTDGKRGRRLTGVTTVTKALDVDPTHLMKWAARTNGIGVAMLAAPALERLRAGDTTAIDDLDFLRSADAIWQRLEAEALTYDDVRDAKATVGTNVHREAFEALAKGAAVPRLEELTATERGYARGVMAFWLDHEPDAELVEQTLVSEKLGVAGRVDLIGRLKACKASDCCCRKLRGRGVLDAKTGNYLGASAHAQVAGYRDLALAAGHGETDWAALLKLTPDGGYRIVPGVATTKDFRNAVAAYRSAGKIDRAAGKQRV